MQNSPFLFPLDSAIKSNQNSVAIRALCDLLDWAPRLREELTVLNNTYRTALLVQFDDAIKINFPMEFLGFFSRVPFDCLSTCAKFTQFQSENVICHWIKCLERDLLLFTPVQTVHQWGDTTAGPPRQSIWYFLVQWATTIRNYRVFCFRVFPSLFQHFPHYQM
jgi:hypothetical protein